MSKDEIVIDGVTYVKKKEDSKRVEWDDSCFSEGFVKSLGTSHTRVIDFIKSDTGYYGFVATIYKTKHGEYWLRFCTDDSMDYDERLLR